MEQYVVTISRQFASMGRTIAQKLAEKWEVEDLVRDMVVETAKWRQQSVETLREAERNKKYYFIRKKYRFNM